jgi:transposase-like protein
MPDKERVTVAEAARRIGITPDAVRKRLERGNIEGERDARGRIYVYLESETSTTTGADTLADSSPTVSATARLIEELQRQNEYLREENRRKDHLLAAALERIPAIESPEPRGGPENAAEPRPGTEAPVSDTGRSRSSWWRRFFGFE